MQLIIVEIYLEACLVEEAERWVVSGKLEHVTPMEVEKVMSIGCTDRDEVENKLIVSSIPCSTICLDRLQNMNNDVSSILVWKHISDTRKI